MKRNRVTLTGDELGRLLVRGKADVRRLKHAQVLLKADEAEDGPGWPDDRVADAAGGGLATVQRLWRRFVEEGFAAALSPHRGGGRRYGTRLDSGQEAHLIAPACAAPPEGHLAGRTLRIIGCHPLERHRRPVVH